MYKKFLIITGVLVLLATSFYIVDASAYPKNRFDKKEFRLEQKICHKLHMALRNEEELGL